MTERTIPTLATWSAIVMGLLVGAMMQVMLNLFGLTLGLAAIDPLGEPSLSAREVPAKVLAWWFVTSMVSLAAAGFIVGWLRRTRGAVDTAIFASTVWALSAILGLWFATTLIGSTISGAYGLLANGGAPPPQIVVRIDDQRSSAPAAQAGGGAAAVRAAPAEPAPGPGLSDTVRSLTWLAIGEAARQLRDPEVRALIRQVALNAWEDTEGFRTELARRLETWVGRDGQLAGGALAELLDWLRRELLIDRETAQAFLEGWEDELEKLAGGADAGSGATNAGGAGSAEGDGAARARALKEQVTAAIMTLRAAAGEIVGAGGALGPERRQAVIDDVAEALTVTRARAQQVVASWETRIARAYRELTRLAEAARRDAGQVTERGFDEASKVTAWMGAGLLAGWLAAVAGALFGAWLPRQLGRNGRA